MKKATLGTALASLLALTACSETDAREKHRYTVEVEVTDTNGKLQKVSQECNQLQNACLNKFKLETPYGEQTFTVSASNYPVHSQELSVKANAVQSQEESDRLTDSEYRQLVSIRFLNLKSPYRVNFKEKRFESANWKPRTERMLKAEINLPDYDSVKKLSLIETKINDENRQGYYKAGHKKRLEALETEKSTITISDQKAADLKIRIY